MIICIETATNLCSVALCDSAGVISLKESNDLKSHASMLTLFIGDILKEAGVNASDLEAVAVSKGPGSYTGLRIGVSVAKGIAFAASIPLIGIETTLSMFTGLKEKMIKEGLPYRDTIFCPMLDARRMEVYYALFDSEGNTIKDISAEIITQDSFKNVPESQNIIFFGDGALKCKFVLKRPGIQFEDDFTMSAANMHKPAVKALKSKQFEDVAYF
ncbi:MAG TPA: tRNA (adenosine(37)-N6)-threonylcarbamoyltransferase complex dimerization subunit type 1 TsaB, partial [Bacteroidales bacterium]|nr:tRNA (adenosine(37)-N6)-threonylcarbamoyltransferase complex dimerization subunit type 1 TsaB [Bacteroidales bacterium]